MDHRFEVKTTTKERREFWRAFTLKDSHLSGSLVQLGLEQGSPFSAAPDVSASPSPPVAQP